MIPLGLQSVKGQKLSKGENEKARRKWGKKGLIRREEYLFADRSLEGCQGLLPHKGKDCYKKSFKIKNTTKKEARQWGLRGAGQRIGK